MKTQLEFKCPTCSKKVETLGEFTYDNKSYYILSCGDFTVKELTLPISSYNSIKSIDGATPYPFQIESMEFLDSCNGRGLIAHEMGLGKTVIGCGYFHQHPEKRPVLIVVKKKLLSQFFKEIYRWNDHSMSQIIQQGHAILPGLEYYIISMDLLRVYPLERLEVLNIKSIWIDECQHIKNPDSQRTMFLRKLISDLNIEHIIATSGTPFKNRLSEYFTILNILAPHYFSNREEFIRRFVLFSFDRAGKMKEMGLKNKDKFKEITSKFITRRERNEVEDQIPYIGIERRIQYCDLEGKFAEAYNNATAEFLELFEKVDSQRSGMARNTELLAILQRMRHVCGLSKIPDCIDFVTDYLLSTERKIAIAIHHQDVGELLIKQLNHWCNMGGYYPCLEIRGNMSSDDLSQVIDKFNKDPKYRILIASTLAAGEGLNLQESCNECIILERQWNAANEEQFEARFRRIGQKTNNVYATYFTAGGTIDEMLTEINERKRALVKSGMLSSDETPYSESNLISQLGEMIEKKRNGQKWRLM